jgi:hypothetical protein
MAGPCDEPIVEGMELIVVVAFFVILAIAAPRWGVDSRPERVR